MIVTFYSFKGGVGRSMALANVGEILADRGYKVLLCDWDLEAPGLERFFVSDRYERFKAFPGIMDLLLDYKETLAGSSEDLLGIVEHNNDDTNSNDTHDTIGNFLIRRPSSYAKPLPSKKKRKGSVHFLSAGRRDGEHYDAYAQATRTFNWSGFYDEWAGDAYFEYFRKQLSKSFEIVLIDSRTGVTEHGGICTHHLADIVVLITAANPLNLEGAKLMATALSSPSLPKLRGGRPLYIIPVAARIESAAEKELLVDFRTGFVDEFAKHLPSTLGSATQFLYATEIPYISHYSYIEHVVALDPPKKSERRLYDAYQSLAEGILRLGLANNLMSAPMHDIFISYTEVDREWVKKLAKALKKREISVSWERSFRSGLSKDYMIESELATAKCVIVVWSHESVSSEIVLAEAHVALDRDILIPVLKESVKLPIAFRQIQSAMMENWDGNSTDPQFASLVASVEHLIRKPSVLEAGTIPETKPEPTTEAVMSRARKIFLSYAREDSEIANRLAIELEKRNFAVFWKSSIRSGQSFDRTIEQALAESECVIVLWSSRSVESDWVRAEAAEGLERGILISIAIEHGVRPPLRFRNIHTEPLIDWDGEKASTTIEKIVSDLSAILGSP